MAIAFKPRVMKAALLSLVTVFLAASFAPTVYASRVSPILLSAARDLHGRITEVLESRAGTICVVKSETGKTYRIASIVIGANAETVWHVLNDYDTAAQVFPCVRKLTLRETRADGSKIVEQVVQPSGLPHCYRNMMEVTEEAYRWQHWHRLSGDCKSIEGTWKLQESEDHKNTTVTYITHVDGGFFVPQAFVNMQAKVDMPLALQGLKTHSEAAGQHSIAQDTPKGAL